MSDVQRELIEGLFQAHYVSLCGFVRRLLDSRELAEEVVQDLFLRLWEQQEAGRDPPLTKAYLYQAARNHALNHLRRRRVERRWHESETVEREPPARTADDELHLQELAQAIDAAIAGMPERRREIFLLHREHELSYADIAQVLGLSIKTVETHMGRALKSLRVSLADFLSLALVALLR